MPEYEGAISELDMIPLIAYLHGLGEAPTSSGRTLANTSAPIPLVGKPTLAVGALAHSKPKQPYPHHGHLSDGAIAFGQNQPGH